LTGENEGAPTTLQKEKGRSLAKGRKKYQCECERGSDFFRGGSAAGREPGIRREKGNPRRMKKKKRETSMSGEREGRSPPIIPQGKKKRLLLRRNRKKEITEGGKEKKDQIVGGIKKERGKKKKKEKFAAGKKEIQSVRKKFLVSDGLFQERDAGAFLRPAEKKRGRRRNKHT